MPYIVLNLISSAKAKGKVNNQAIEIIMRPTRKIKIGQICPQTLYYVGKKEYPEGPIVDKSDI